MYVISGKKRESSPFRHIVKSLMHPYSVRSGYIRFPTVTNHQGFAQFGLSSRQGKIEYRRPRLQHSEIFRKNHFLKYPSTPAERILRDCNSRNPLERI